LALTQFFLGDTGEGTFNAIPFSLELAGAPDQLTAKLATGELDAALLPVNLASVLYNRTDGDIRLAAITGMGLFYAVANNALRGDSPEITSFADLADANVVSFGLGATPQYVIEYLAQYYGTNLDITFTAEPPEAVAQLLAGQAHVGILPEPFVTSLITQNPDFEVVVSLAEAWEQATGSPLVTTALVFRTEFLTAYPQTTQYLNDAVASSIVWVKENPADAAVVIAEQMILPSVEIAEAAIPRTNLIWLTGETARTSTTDFLTVLYNTNPSAIGGNIPDAGFFVE
jgi:NitT/TauT family transport system substrate-binding protein